jgi:hypothetical protein
MRNVLRTGPVAAFTAHIPLGDGFGVDVVVDRVTTIAERTSGTFGVVGWIDGSPPVCALFGEVRAPHLILDIPLRRQREIVGAFLLEIALLPLAAVDEGDVSGG